MRYLVTGANGFIGSNLVKHISFSSDEVLGVCRSTFEGEDSLNIVRIDYSNDSIAAVVSDFQPDVVIHCAGGANVGYSVSNPVNDYQNSVTTCYEVIESTRQMCPSAHFMYISSAAVYGSPEELPINENAVISPVSPYGLHKEMCEQVCRYYGGRYGMHTSIVRIFSAYGEGQKKQLLWDIFQKSLQDKQIELYGTGNESRDFIHIDDIVSALLLISKEDYSDVYNLANGQEITVREIAAYMCSELGIDFSSIRFTNQKKEGDPSRWQADITKLQKIGYKTSIGIETGISRYVRWAKQNA